MGGRGGASCAEVAGELQDGCDGHGARDGRALVASVVPWGCAGQRAAPRGPALSTVGVCVTPKQGMVAGGWICWGGVLLAGTVEGVQGQHRVTQADGSSCYCFLLLLQLLLLHYAGLSWPWQLSPPIPYGQTDDTRLSCSLLT